MNFWKDMLDKLTAVWYNDTPERGTGSSPSSSLSFAKESTMGTQNEFSFNPTQAKIQGLSVQVGELFAKLYSDTSTSAEDVDNALEAYKSLRRMLPREFGYGRHVGAQAAHKATQGQS